MGNSARQQRITDSLNKVPHIKMNHRVSILV
jgi:hypothetical protein